jgi:hypothetical protein
MSKEQLRAFLASVLEWSALHPGRFIPWEAGVDQLVSGYRLDYRAIEVRSPAGVNGFSLELVLQQE